MTRAINALPPWGRPSFMAPRMHGRVHHDCDSQLMIPWMEPLIVERGINFKDMFLLVHRTFHSLLWPPTAASLRTCGAAILRAFAASRISGGA